MRIRVLAAIALLAAPIASVQANEWHIGGGLSYPSGAQDVIDLYEANYKAQGYTVKITQLLPFGIAFDAHYQWDNGLRAGAGFGPLLMVTGDGSHTEIPINGTVGYTFLPKGGISPYIKAGVVYHIANGDFVRSSSPGVLGAVGIEFSRTSAISYTLELAIDKSEVEFDRYKRNSSGTLVRDNYSFNTYDTVVSFYVKFGRISGSHSKKRSK